MLPFVHRTISWKWFPMYFWYLHPILWLFEHIFLCLSFIKSFVIKFGTRVIELNVSLRIIIVKSTSIRRRINISVKHSHRSFSLHAERKNMTLGDKQVLPSSLFCHRNHLYICCCNSVIRSQIIVDWLWCYQNEFDFDLTSRVPKWVFEIQSFNRFTVGPTAYAYLFRSQSFWLPLPGHFWNRVSNN